MGLSAFNSAVRVISEDIGGLPWFVYKRLERGREKQRKHPAFKLLHKRPNDWMTAFVFKRWMVAQALIRGNAYAEIQFDQGGRPIALWPLITSMTRPVFKNGELYYETPNRDLNGTATLKSENVFHLRGLGDDPFCGISVVEYAKRSLGIAIDAEIYSSSFFRNLGKLAGVLQHPKTLGDQALEHLEKSIAKQHGGPEQAHRLLILEEDMKYQATSATPEQSQLLESRKFSVTEIARWFRMPPHKIGDLEKATFSNIESQERSYVINCLLPWLVQLESEADLKLLSDGESEEFFTKMSVDALLRGDFQARMAGYAIGRQWGWWSANDVREFEEQNPIGEEGDIYLVPLNMVPADQVREINAAGAGGAADVQKERSKPLLSRLEAAHRGLFDGSAMRLAKRELDAVLRWSKKDIASYGEEFGKFYGEFQPAIRSTFLPIVTAFVEMAIDVSKEQRAQLDELVQEAVEACAISHCQRSRGIVGDLVAAGGQKLVDGVNTWKEKRGAQLRDEMIAAARDAAIQLALQLGNAEIKTEVAA